MSHAVVVSSRYAFGAFGLIRLICGFSYHSVAVSSFFASQLRFQLTMISSSSCMYVCRGSRLVSFIEKCMIKIELAARVVLQRCCELCSMS